MPQLPSSKQGARRPGANGAAAWEFAFVLENPKTRARDVTINASTSYFTHSQRSTERAAKRCGA